METFENKTFLQISGTERLTLTLLPPASLSTPQLVSEDLTSEDLDEELAFVHSPPSTSSPAPSPGSVESVSLFTPSETESCNTTTFSAMDYNSLSRQK